MDSRTEKYKKGKTKGNGHTFGHQDAYYDFVNLNLLVLAFQ